MQLQIIDSLLY